MEDTGGDQAGGAQDGAIQFRSIRPQDFPMLREWLSRPHMKPWWDEGDETLAQVAASYTRNPATTWRFIASEDGVDIGYFQYWREPGFAGVDQFLAEPSRLGQGLGTRALTAFLAHLVGLGIGERVSVDPHPSNTAAIRCYEKCGFVHDPDRSTDEVHFMERPLRDDAE